MDILYQVFSLEVVRVVMVESLGEVLVYLNGVHHSSYPNNRMCVLWDLQALALESVAMWMKDDITIWQPIIFKNIPFTCFICKEYGHMAQECTIDLKRVGRTGNKEGIPDESNGGRVDQDLTTEASNPLEEMVTEVTVVCPRRENKYIPPDMTRNFDIGAQKDFKMAGPEDRKKLASGGLGIPVGRTELFNV